MTKNQFLNILIDGLKDIPENEFQKIISHYSSEIEKGLQMKLSEDYIISQFGDPNEIINNLKNSKYNKTYLTANFDTNSKLRSNKHSFLNWTKREDLNSTELLLRVFFILLFIAIVLPLLLTITSFLLGSIIVLFNILVLGLLMVSHVLIGQFIEISIIPIFLNNLPSNSILFFGLGSIFLSIFLIILLYYISKFFIKLVYTIYRHYKQR